TFPFAQSIVRRAHHHTSKHNSVGTAHERCCRAGRHRDRNDGKRNPAAVHILELLCDGRAIVEPGAGAVDHVAGGTKWRWTSMRGRCVACGGAGEAGSSALAATAAKPVTAPRRDRLQLQVGADWRLLSPGMTGSPDATLRLGLPSCSRLSTSAMVDEISRWEDAMIRIWAALIATSGLAPRPRRSSSPIRSTRWPPSAKARSPGIRRRPLLPA